MLTRHSPPRAVGRAEAGWLVGESDGRSRPSSRPSDRPNFQDFPSPFTMRAPVGIVRRVFPREPLSKQKKSASRPSCLSRKAAAASWVSLRPRGTNRFPPWPVWRSNSSTQPRILDRSGTRAAPESSDRALDGVAFCYPTQSQDQIQEKICRLLVFFSSRAPVMLLRSRHGLSLPGQGSRSCLGLSLDHLILSESLSARQGLQAAPLPEDRDWPPAASPPYVPFPEIIRSYGCTSASAFRIFHFAGFGATSERVAGTGTEVGDQAVIITQGGGSHLQNRLGTLGIVPEHLRPLEPVIQLLHQ